MNIGMKRRTESRKKRWEDSDGGEGQSVGEVKGQTVGGKGVRQQEKGRGNKLKEERHRQPEEERERTEGKKRNRQHEE